MLKFKKFIIIFILIIITLSLCGCNNNKNNQEELKEKVIKEIEYLDTEIVSILNKLNNISLENYTVTSKEVLVEENTDETSNKQSTSDEKPNDKTEDKSNTITVTEMSPNIILVTSQSDTDWNTIKNEIEILNSSWSIIVLDLYTLNVDNNIILEFSNGIDNALSSVNEENKENSLTNLAKLYESIPKFLKAISAENSIQNAKQTKSYVLNAYSVVNKNDWSKVDTEISNAETSFKNVINDIEYTKNNEYKVNKIYVLINELKNSLKNQNQKIFYVKYKDLLEAINSL